MNEHKEFVTGFLFNLLLDQIVLIRKTKPLWQSGRLNGVGGKIEDRESPGEAMKREFEEETGAALLGWTEYAVVKNKANDHVIHYFFKASQKNLTALVKTTTEEEVVVRGLRSLLGDAITMETLVHPNLSWLIAAAYTCAGRVVEPHEVLHIDGWWKTE